MHATATPDPVTEFATRNRPAFAAVLFLAAALCLVPAIIYGIKAFRSSAPAAAVETASDPFSPEKPKAEATPNLNQAEHIGIFVAAILGTLIATAGGLYTLAGPDLATDSDRYLRSRMILLCIGGLLGLLAMLLALFLFYEWFESLTKWLNDGETGEAKWVLIPVLIFLVGAGLAFAAAQPARAEERSNQNLRRLVYAVNLGLTAFLLFAVLLIGNVFASMRIPNRLDTTASGFYTLDPKTKEYLEKLDAPVTVYAALPDRIPEAARLTDDARRMLLSAQDQNPGKFKVKFLSETLNKDEITRLKGKYPQADLSEFGILMTTGENESRSAFIRIDDLVKRDGGGFGGAPPRVAFSGEAALVRELMFLTDASGKPIIYFTQGSGELEVAPSNDPSNLRRSGRTANQIRTVLEKGYADVRTWEPEAINPKVPADCAVLVVADPKTPLSKEVADAIRVYMTEAKDGKKGKLIVLAGANPKPVGGGISETGLEETLAGLGIRVGNKIILGRPMLVFGQPLDWNEHFCQLYQGPEGRNSIARIYIDKGFFMFDLRTVEPAAPPGMGGPFNADPLLITQRRRSTFLETEKPADIVKAWNELVGNEDLALAKQVSGNPRIVGVVAREGETIRAVVIGCGEFFADPSRRGQQASSEPSELFANLVSWIRDRPAAAAVANKAYGEYTPSKTASTFRLYFLPVTLTLLAVIALGVGVWVVRRK